MSATLILTAGLLIAIPVAIKYFFAFEIRGLVEKLKTGEREVSGLHIRLVALQREQDVVRGAMQQIVEHRNWAEARRGILKAELSELKSFSQESVPNQRKFEPTTWANSSWSVDEQAPALGSA